MKQRVHITLFDDNAKVAAEGDACITGREVSLSVYWFVTGFFPQLPRDLIERIALNWVDDGGDREYDGFDEGSEVQFNVTPNA